MFTQRFRIISASIIGNLLEWYDFALFGVFATLIAQNFFPKEDVNASLIGSFGALAVGYFMRPIGGLIWGHLGDQKSRRIALILSLLVMGLATTLIGLLPSYASIGIWATILLVLFRMAQGLAVGGEFPGSFVILIEKAKSNRRAFTASLALTGAGSGFLAGIGVSSLLDHMLSSSQMHTWGWRVPFLLGFVLAILGLYIRTKIWSDEVGNLPTIKHLPFFTLLKENKAALIKSFCVLAIGAVFSGMFSIFLMTYLTRYLHYSLTFGLNLLFITMLIMVIAFPLASIIADHFKIHKVWVSVGLLIFAIVTYPLFMLMQHGSLSCAVAVIVLVVIYCLGIGPFIPLMVDLFPKNVRYSGVAITHGLAFSIVGGTAPLILNGMVLKWGVLSPSYYLIGVSLVAMLAVLFIKKEYTHENL